MTGGRASGTVDVLMLSLGTTTGLRVADAELAGLLEAAGASVAVAGTRIGALGWFRRGYPVNHAIEALAARRALRAAEARYLPRSVVVSTPTAALLQDPPFAVWLDSPARLNRPGWRNRPVHALERRQLSRARLVLAWSPAAAAALPAGAARAVVVPPPIPAAALETGGREPLAVAYAPDPHLKGLDLLLEAWGRAGLPSGARLVVAGLPASAARSYLSERRIVLPSGVELPGILPRAAFLELLSRARAFVSAARWEDFGIAPLEALDRGAALVCAPAGGPFPALAIAQALAPELVAPDRSSAALAVAIRGAFEIGDRPAYQAAARDQLAPYRPEAVIERLRADVLPVLIGA
jgi:glycosyltransferase involved in cell wall biosynthesis